MAEKPADLVGRVLRDFQADEKPHRQFADNVDRWYRAYRGVIEARSRAAEWTSKLHPAYAFQVIETLTANVVDPSPRWRVKPRPVMDSPERLLRLQRGAQANELLLAEQVACDRFVEKQAPFAKQAFVAGLSVYKTYWEYAERDVREQAVVYDEVAPGVKVPRLGFQKNRRPVKDNPTAEVVDVRDWFPHEGAVTLDKAARVTHRVFYTFDELKQLEAQGVYGEKAGGQPVDLLKDSRGFAKDASSREQDLFQTDRTKDKIEVLEQWRRQPDGSIAVVSVGNRGVLLRNTPSPFDHGRFPFVVCRPVPDFGRIPGVSVIELIEGLQEAAWSFLNQRIDNTELLNNAVVLLATDYEGDFEWAPGAQNVVDRPDQVSLLNVNPISSEISLKAEEMIKEDLQNIPGASPTLLGQTDPSTQTATEVSLTTSLAQRRIALMKQQFRVAHANVGEDWLALNQQFVTSTKAVSKVGLDGAHAFEEIHPLLIQGDYYIQLDSMDESLMRQERRAEAQAKLQVALNAAQFFAAIPSQPPLNLRAFMDDYLDSFDTLDKDKYYSALPQPAAPPGQPAQPGATGPAGAGGVTAPQAYDATSPSNAVSMSPLAALQRQGASTGGPNNL